MNSFINFISGLASVSFVAFLVALKQDSNLANESYSYSAYWLMPTIVLLIVGFLFSIFLLQKEENVSFGTVSFWNWKVAFTMLSFFMNVGFLVFISMQVWELKFQHNLIWFFVVYYSMFACMQISLIIRDINWFVFRVKMRNMTASEQNLLFGIR